MQEQLRELWRRFQAHPPRDRALFLALPSVAAVLIVVGALMLGQATPGGSGSGGQAPPAVTANRPGSVPLGSPSLSPAVAGPGPADSDTAEGSTPDLSADPAAGPPPPPGAVRRVRVVNTEGQGANMRREPSTSSERVAVIREGTELELIGPDAQGAGRTWRNVQDASGNSGWIPAEFLGEERVLGVRRAPTPVPLTIQVTDITSTVARGEVATLTIATRPGTRCEVRVLLFGPSTAPREGLEPKTADSGGECSWTWTVPQDVVPGTWRYMIVVGSGDQRVTREVTFAVR